MKFILIKIIFGFCIVISINGCHTFEHQNIFLQNVNKNSNQELIDAENRNSEIDIKKNSENSEMAPIKTPKHTEKVQKLPIQKNFKFPNAKKFSLNKFINWNEEKLIKVLGKSRFLKEEGKLKNYQYYFKSCFLDVFLLKKKKNYLVNYIETRPTKLNGAMNIKACLKEISKVVK